MSEATVVMCAECASPMVLRETKRFQYKNGSPRKFWGCSRFPECRCTHGAHPDGRPLGTPGDSKTKAARMVAHVAFDMLWKDGSMSRTSAYAWLANEFGLDEIHIGALGVDDCKRVVEVCAKRFKK